MKLKYLIPLLVTLLLPATALAHMGNHVGIHHGSAFIMGLAHPYTGLDHIGAMLAVGMWSMLAFNQSPRGMWVAPVAFASFLLIGGLLGFYGAGLPIVEPMIASSLLILGLLVALRIRFSLLVGALVVATFAVFHGIAHGSELPVSGMVAALSGMLLGTMLLHIGGMLLAHFFLRRNIWLPRIAGGVVAVLGMALLSGVI